MYVSAWLTIPTTTKNITTPNEKKTAKTLVEMVECLMCNNFTIASPAMMYMNEVSVSIQQHSISNKSFMQ